MLKTSEAPELVEPAPVAAEDPGVRLVDDDAPCEELRERGVEVLNGQVNRPWGIRTAGFRDPGGHIWEIAH